MENQKISRRDMIGVAGTASLGIALLCGCEKRREEAADAGTADKAKADYSHEEYVWLSARANLPLFVAHDHRALQQIGRELGVQVTIAGPDVFDIAALVTAIEQTIVRKPAGLMVVGWDPSALVAPINRAVDRDIPVICVDADVAASKRLAFVGTDWYDLGVRQGQAMLKALGEHRGKIAMLGLIEQYIDQQAFAGFRSIVEKQGLEVMEPLEDKGSIAEAARVATAVIQSTPDLAGIAGFDSESGPGIGMAIKESGKAGRIVATTVDAEEHHLRLVKEGVLTAAIGQKRELFTYYGTRVLFDINHTSLRFTENDKQAGVSPVPEIFYTGSYTVTEDNVDLFLKAAG